MRATRVSTTPCLTDEQLRWYQFDPNFNWLDLSRGGEFLSPDARRPITLYDEGLDAFETVFYGSPLVQSSWAPRTRSTYQGWVCVYCRFCALRGLPPLPVQPTLFLAWLDALFEKLSGRTITVAITAIVAWSALNDLPHPADRHPVLRRAWMGLVRTRSVRTRPQKLPISEAFVLAMFRDFWRHYSHRLIEDFALTRSVASTLLGFELGPRVVELRHFALCDYYPMPDHSADVHFLDTKNNAGQRDSQAWGSLAAPLFPLQEFPSASAFMDKAYLPALRLMGVSKHRDCLADRQRMVQCRRCPRLFPTLSSNGGTGTMTGQHVAAMVQFWLRRLGVQNPERYSGISLRSGTATLAAMQKVDPDILQWHMRWSHGIRGTYTDRPQHARLAVSSAVACSFEAASSSAAARLATSYHDECALCGQGGRDLLLCDADLCQNVAHVRCAKHVQVPKGAWFCHVCACPPTSPGAACKAARMR